MTDESLSQPTSPGGSVAYGDPGGDAIPADILARIDAIRADLEGPKPWYQSRAIWGVIILALSMGAEALCQISMVCVHIDQGAALEAVTRGGELLGLVLTFVGRIKATKPVTFRRVR